MSFSSDLNYLFNSFFSSNPNVNSDSSSSSVQFSRSIKTKRKSPGEAFTQLTPIIPMKISELKIPKQRSDEMINLSDLTAKLPKKPSLINEKAEDNTDWYNAFRQYLIALLSLFVTSKGVPNEEVIQELVSDENMPLWIQAFTNETYNTNVNYEVLEALGDRVLEYAFVRYLINRFPDINPNSINNYKTAYLSKKSQAPVARALKFNDWVLVGEESETINVLEDLTESFAGALDLLGDKIRLGLGPILVYKFVTTLFSRANFDPRLTFGAPRTQVEQIFSRLGLGTTKIYDSLGSDGSAKATIILPDAAYAFLKDEGITGVPKPLAYGFGITKKEARNNAWQNALDKLDEFGVNTEWGEGQAQKIQLERYGELFQKALERARSEGFNRIIRKIPQSTSGFKGRVIQLIGIADLKDLPFRREILASTMDQDTEAGTQRLLEEYVKYGKMKE